MLKFLINTYTDNSILKDILRLKILRTWIKIRANSFIKTLVNIMKWKSTKVPWKLSLAKKKCDPALERTLHQNGWYFACCYTLLFLSNLVLKSNSVFMDMFDSFRHSLFTFLPLFYGFWSSSNASMPFRLIQCAFCKVSILFSKKNSFNMELLLKAKIPLDVIISCYLYIPCKSWYQTQLLVSDYGVN